MIDRRTLSDIVEDDDHFSLLEYSVHFNPIVRILVHELEGEYVNSLENGFYESTEYHVADSMYVVKGSIDTQKKKKDVYFAVETGNTGFETILTDNVGEVIKKRTFRSIDDSCYGVKEFCEGYRCMQQERVVSFQAYKIEEENIVFVFIDRGNAFQGVKFALIDGNDGNLEIDGQIGPQYRFE